MAKTDTVRLSLDEARRLCIDAAMAAGARRETAEPLAISAVAAEADGQPTVGISHFMDHLTAIEAGRINGNALPEITRPAKAIFVSDANGGAAQPGFDLAFDDFVTTAQDFGVAVFAQKNAFTCGSLGYFAGRLAERGLVAFAATNGPALVAGSGGTKPVYCTNPLAFAAPSADGVPLLIDQASSATAFVNIRRAAEEGRSIPEGWALDSQGKPTTDPAEAVKGTLLAFGGARGGNIALMVEVLAAGVGGATWSVDAPPWGAGSKGPGSGLFIVAIAPELIDPDFQQRVAAHLRRLAADYDVHIPGRSKAEARKTSEQEGIVISAELHAQLLQWIAS
ncbi:MAG TPA: Ldh family oxidoreductase [Rhizobiaceae bacterium]|nr:Ldh family oxidoreductase [Rhizobiaceae bacterium]